MKILISSLLSVIVLSACAFAVGQTVSTSPTAALAKPQVSYPHDANGNPLPYVEKVRKPKITQAAPISVAPVNSSQPVTNSSSILSAKDIKVTQTLQENAVPSLSVGERSEIRDRMHLLSENNLSGQLAASNQRISDLEKPKIENDMLQLLQKYRISHNIPGTWQFDFNAMSFVAPSSQPSK